jgi:hypothetical protein
MEVSLATGSKLAMFGDFIVVALTTTGAIIVITAVFLTRFSYHIYDTTNGGDSFDHYILIDVIRDANHRVPKKTDHFATDGAYHYPFLLHWLLSFVPYECESIGRYFSAVMDVLFCGVVATAAGLNYITPLQTVLGFGIVLATPQLIRPDLSHGTGISARKVGLLFVSVAVLLFTPWVLAGSTVSLCVSLSAGSLVFLTSKFSTQAYIILSLGLSILITPLYGVAFLAAAVLAVVISRGRYLRILESHLRHLWTYATYTQYKTPGLVPKNPLTEVAGFVQDVMSIRSIGELKAVLQTNLVTRAFVNIPHVPFGLVLIAVEWQQLMSSPTNIFVIWFLIAVCAFAVTSLPYLRFLGQSERYLEFSLLPAAILFSVFITESVLIGSVLYVLVLITGLYVIGLYIRNHYDQTDDRDSLRQMDKITDNLRLKNKSVVLSQPRYYASEIAWKTGHSVVEFSLHAGSDSEYPSELRHLCPVDMNHITDDIEWLRHRYDPDWVIFERKSTYPEGTLSPSDSDPICENEKFLLYKFDTLIRDKPNG